MYTDSWAPSGLLYVPLSRPGGGFENSLSYYKGFPWHKQQASYSNKGGEFVLFADNNAIDLIKDKYTRSACIGIAMMFDKYDYEPLTRKRAHDLWDFKLLFEPSLDIPKSRLVIPKPHNLRERMEDAKVKLL